MALLWDEEVHINISTYSQRHINIWVTRTEIEWMLTCFYGNPETDKRQEGWGILSHMNLIKPKRWLCIGDFNEVLHHSEKYGGTRRADKQIDDFRNVLQDCQLWDLGFTQGKYTWSNFRQDHNFTKERLDRAIANSEWCAMFGGGEVQVLASSTSDHCPILMNVGNRMIGIPDQITFADMKTAGLFSQSVRRLFRMLGTCMAETKKASPRSIINLRVVCRC
ncbi:hypothetical protein F2P56_022920 [Juglans regia]|uniref:Exo_endo_phos domain-containing protein n=1 Tax=Juglans regia TaxID=51240 RepID=A0A833U920_JUGRE|nr:hypothetical protein F2P56_022920 [Juglans regia]